MATLTQPRRMTRKLSKPTLVESYDISADSKRRISLRRTGSKYFSVFAFSDGTFKLEPRKLVPAEVTIERVERVPIPKGARRAAVRLAAAIDNLPRP